VRSEHPQANLALAVGQFNRIEPAGVLQPSGAGV